jgi:hypothetical protein
MGLWLTPGTKIVPGVEFRRSRRLFGHIGEFDAGGNPSETRTAKMRVGSRVSGVKWQAL